MESFGLRSFAAADGKRDINGINIHDLLGGDVFKIIVAHSETGGDSINAGMPDETPPSSRGNNDNIVPKTPKKQEAFYIHKKLLASLSPEWEKHVKNEMREGIEGSMMLHDVDSPTVRRFLQWAYTQEYSIPDGLPKGASLQVDIKMFVLADRFNIKRLAKHSFARLSAHLRAFDGTKDDVTLAWIMGACVYAFAQLPTQPAEAFLGDKDAFQNSDNINGTAAGAYLISFIAYKLDIFKLNHQFGDFLNKNHHIAQALLYKAQNSRLPPWRDPKDNDSLSSDSDSRIPKYGLKRVSVFALSQPTLYLDSE
ncbi:hypothetical protein DFH27DRAFT_535038 [Peziza echinospora]|nr:hypothetical protein DFH27DRAFT_535038 [Peziza echinospora]